MALLTPGDLLHRMVFIRAFEAALADRPDHGFQLLSAGEEAVAVGLSFALNEQDQLLTGGRSIGPALARGLDPDRVMAELLGRSTGCNGGRAGRGHMADPDCGFFGAHAVVGGNISIAAGVALSFKLSGVQAVVTVLFGDGACGSGALTETLNIAAVWKLPLLFVCCNNGYSVSTPRSAVLAPAALSDIGRAYGLPARTVDGMDIEAVIEAATGALEFVRSGQGPAFLECLSERFSSHSTTAREIRGEDELARIRERCPIDLYFRALLERGTCAPTDLEQFHAEAQARVSKALAFADASPFPLATGVLAHVW